MERAHKRHCAASTLDVHRARYPEVDALYVPLLRNDEEASNMEQRVKAARVDTVTLHFYHHIAATKTALMEEADTVSSPLGKHFDLYVERDGELHVHVLYAVLKLSMLLKLTTNYALEDLLANRMLQLLEIYKPMLEWHDHTAMEMFNKMHVVPNIVAEKITALAKELSKSPERIGRLDQWSTILKALVSARQRGLEMMEG